MRAPFWFDESIEYVPVDAATICSSENLRVSLKKGVETVILNVCESPLSAQRIRCEWLGRKLFVTLCGVLRNAAKLRCLDLGVEKQKNVANEFAEAIESVATRLEQLRFVVDTNGVEEMRRISSAISLVQNLRCFSSSFELNGIECAVMLADALNTMMASSPLENFELGIIERDDTDLKDLDEFYGRLQVSGKTLRKCAFSCSVFYPRPTIAAFRNTFSRAFELRELEINLTPKRRVITASDCDRPEHFVLFFAGLRNTRVSTVTIVAPIDGNWRRGLHASGLLDLGWLASLNMKSTRETKEEEDPHSTQELVGRQGPTWLAISGTFGAEERKLMKKYDRDRALKPKIVNRAVSKAVRSHAYWRKVCASLCLRMLVLRKFRRALTAFDPQIVLLIARHIWETRNQPEWGEHWGEHWGKNEKGKN